MKIKNILCRNYDTLTESEKKYYHDNRDRLELNLCDKNKTVHFSKELTWVSEDFENLTDEQIEVIDLWEWEALSDKAIDEIEDYLTFPNFPLFPNNQPYYGSSTMSND